MPHFINFVSCFCILWNREAESAALFGLIPIQEGMLSSAHASHLFSSADYIFEENINTSSIYTTLAQPTIYSVMEGFNGRCVPCKPRFHLQVIMKLVEPLQGKDHCLFVDNFYTSPSLLFDLLTNNQKKVSMTEARQNTCHWFFPVCNNGKHTWVFLLKNVWYIACYLQFLIELLGGCQSPYLQLLKM